VPGYAFNKGVKAARVARERLGLASDGPVSDLLELVETRVGLPVAIFALHSGIAGAYLERPGGSVVLLHGLDPAVRLRFTLAHELGHHELGHGAAVDTAATLYGGGGDAREVQANAFAAELLLPAQLTRAWLEETAPGPVTLENVVRLAAVHGVSAKMACIRIETAGALNDPPRRARLHREIDSGEHTRLAASLNLPEFRDGIAEAREALPRVPERLGGSPLFAYARGEISAADLAAGVGRPPAQVERTMRAFGLRPTDP
jgi:Zn-dependent peptidase ImmA (M78 family)